MSVLTEMSTNLPRSHYAAVKHFRRLLPLAAILSIFALTMAGFVIELYFPYRPTEQEVREFLLKPPAYGDSLTASSYEQFEVLQVRSLGHWQIALSTFKQHRDQTPCFGIDFVSKHWLSGLKADAGTGTCYSPLAQKSTILLASLHRKGYAVGGIVIDERIVRIQATWFDGTQSIHPIDDGAFLIVRPDDIGLAWVVGLNDNGAITNDSLTYDDGLDISPLNYSEIHQVTTGSGVILLGAYSQTTPIARECIQLTYATVENFRRSLSGQTYFTGQTACVDFIGQSKGPSVGTVIDGNMVVGGRFLDKAVAFANIQWSDGWQQTVSVDNGFYFAQRPGYSVTVAFYAGLDSDGNVIAP